MRLWSLHPKYLDAKGLVALWREALLAKHVLEGKTKGYRHHPQLHRFKEQKDPLNAICRYLAVIVDEAERRNYNFDRRKAGSGKGRQKITITTGQLAFEYKHLLRKLKIRDTKKFKELHKLHRIKTHPLFRQRKGSVEQWEIQ